MMSMVRGWRPWGSGASYPSSCSCSASFWSSFASWWMTLARLTRRTRSLSAGFTTPRSRTSSGVDGRSTSSVETSQAGATSTRSLRATAWRTWRRSFVTSGVFTRKRAVC